MRSKGMMLAILIMLAGVFSLGARPPTQAGSQVIRIVRGGCALQRWPPHGGIPAERARSRRGAAPRGWAGPMRLPGRARHLGIRGRRHLLHALRRGGAERLAGGAGDEQGPGSLGEEGAGAGVGQARRGRLQERFLRRDLQGRQDLAHVLHGHAQREFRAESHSHVSLSDDEGEEPIAHRSLDKAAAGRTLPLPAGDLLLRDRQSRPHRQAWRRVSDVL